MAKPYCIIYVYTYAGCSFPAFCSCHYFPLWEIVKRTFNQSIRNLPGKWRIGMQQLVRSRRWNAWELKWLACHRWFEHAALFLSNDLVSGREVRHERSAMYVCVYIYTCIYIYTYLFIYLWSEMYLIKQCCLVGLSMICLNTVLKSDKWDISMIT